MTTIRSVIAGMRMRRAMAPPPTSEWGLDPLFWVNVKVAVCEIVGPDAVVTDAEGGHGAVRDVSEYARYRGFLDRSLVLLPQATAEHSTVRHHSATTAFEIEPRTSGPQAKVRATVRAWVHG